VIEGQNTALAARNSLIEDLQRRLDEATRVRVALIDENRRAAQRVQEAEQRERAAYERFRTRLTAAEREPSCQALLDTPLCGGLADE